MSSSGNGYAGQILHIDLTRGRIAKEPLDTALARDYVGGMGFGTRILFDQVKPEVEPLSPDNLLILATGPLTGTMAPTSSRVDITTKSPMSGAFGTANAGGFWAPTLKYAGYDAVVVKGRAERPAYIWIDDAQVQIREAGHLWGKDAWETVDAIRDELGESSPHEIRVLSIGPAGENLVRYAAITSDYVFSASRSGVGAVMGSKNLKAVAVRGRGGITVAQPKRFEAAVIETYERIVNDPRHKTWPLPGPLTVSDGFQRTGQLPARNYQTGVLPNWVETRGAGRALEYIMESPNPHGLGIACHCCPIRCYRWVELEKGKYAGLKLGGLFVAFVLQFGAVCGIDNLPAIWKCEELVQRLGMDLISASGSIAFAMELYQRGILGREDTDGLALDWGNEDAVIKLLGKIARREGLGDLLAEGSARAARRIGRGAEHYAMVVKDAEIFSDQARAGHGAWSFGVLTSPRGGDNVKSTHAATFFTDEFIENARQRNMTVEEYTRWFVENLDMFEEVKKKIFGVPPRLDPHSLDTAAPMTKWYEDISVLTNALGVCLMGHTALHHKLGPTYYARLYSACTGWETSPRELMKKAERIFTLQKLYQVAHGLGKGDDHWPKRFYVEELPEGPSQGRVLDRERIDRLLSEYYGLRGWDEDTGLPTKGTLQELGLSEDSP